MRCLTPQVAWHNKEPVLSIDFDPTTLISTNPVILPSILAEVATNPVAPVEDINASNDDKMEIDEAPAVLVEPSEMPASLAAPADVHVELIDSATTHAPPIQPSNFYRFASGGADMLLLVWHLRNPDSLKPELTCVAELTRHLKSVNVVRFSGDGKFIASADDDAYICIWKCDGKSDKEENWLLEKSLRKHYEDVSDLCWSKDSNFLVSGSVDNSAVLWDVKKGTVLHTWSEHGGLVQGVAFDPLGEFVISVCTDRTLRLFNSKSGKVLSRTLKYPSDWIKRSTDNVDDTEDKENDDLEKPNKLQPLLQANRIFHDDTLRTFCRRPQFSPRGELLLVPGALLPPNYDNDNSPGKKKPKESNHSAVVFCRNSFTNPCAIIPSGASYAIACRFCPVYFYRNREVIKYDPELTNSTKKSERTISCVGKLKSGKPEETVLMNMPYRIVFAIATNDSVIIGDTESAEPLAVVGNIHCTRLSDLTWSSDGRVILISSTDGFCTCITFEENELGRAYPMDNLPELLPNSFPVEAKAVPVKDNEAKKKVQKEDKQKDKDIKNPSVDVPKIPIPKVFTPKDKKNATKKTEPKTVNIPSEPKQDKEREATPPPKGRELELAAAVITPTTEIRESLSKIKVTPRRNTLDRWVQKTPKSMEKQLEMEKQEAEADARLMSKLEATLPISSEELAKLKEAPIIVDLESDEEVDDLGNSCLHTIPILDDESKPKLDIVPLKDEDLPVLDIVSPGPSVKANADVKLSERTEAEGEKRVSDSPVSSRPTKQPRRVQLITLAAPSTKTDK